MTCLTLAILSGSLWSAAFDPSLKELITTLLLAVGPQGQDTWILSANLVYGRCQVWLAQSALPLTCNSTHMCQSWSLSLWPKSPWKERTQVSEARNCHSQMVLPHGTLRLATLLQDICALLRHDQRIKPYSSEQCLTQVIYQFRSGTVGCGPLSDLRGLHWLLKAILSCMLGLISCYLCLGVTHLFHVSGAAWFMSPCLHISRT